MIRKARVLLIEIGKMLPFIICSIVALSYVENLRSLIMTDYVLFDDSIVLNKSISWWIGQYFEYNITTVVILLIISVAIETCRWNKLACLYLGIGLAEKSYFDFELDIETIYCICIINIIASTYLTYKGIKIITKQ